ncbi:MAG: DNA translocase FtsK, partial [Planctomycetes bacterium]|nr:DNA translocase FtsK [Planctomycetota bacterium]
FDLILERGTKISKITGLADDLALALGVTRVRIAPVKGKSALGVEIPNKKRETVFLRELAVAQDLSKRKIAIPLFLGKDASCHPFVEDLATTPHLLIAGRTGAGKSVFVNNLILSILLTRYPEECRLIMIDPKKVELEVYQDIPHLLTKVESSPKKATKILEWAVNQMEERYELLAAVGVRHLTSYNKLTKPARREKLLKLYSEEEVGKIPEHLPYVVIIVDELADLMMASGKEVEQAIARLAQKARAVGIHVVLATQRPSTDVITGLIKSNLPARIGFQTRTGIDSRTILDRYGAEKLLDRGDMLYLSSTSDDPRRVQGPFVSDDEVDRVVKYLKENATPLYTHQLEQVQSGGGEIACILDSDELFEQAVDVMFSSGMASASGLQRRLRVGYARASRLIDLMADAGIVSEHRGSKAREILMSPEQWEEIRQGARKTAGVS